MAVCAETDAARIAFKRPELHTIFFRVIENACAEVGRSMPFDFWITHCARDAWWLAFGERKATPKPHRAVEDCLVILGDLRQARGNLLRGASREG